MSETWSRLKKKKKRKSQRTRLGILLVGKVVAIQTTLTLWEETDCSIAFVLIPPYSLFCFADYVCM